MMTEGIELLHQTSHAIEAVAELFREVQKNCSFKDELDTAALDASLTELIKFKTNLLTYINTYKKEQSDNNGT